MTIICISLLYCYDYCPIYLLQSLLDDYVVIEKNIGRSSLQKLKSHINTVYFKSMTNSYQGTWTNVICI